MCIFNSHGCECEDCVLGWEDMDYEGDCNDCGCLYYGGLYGNRFICRLPKCIKSLIYKVKMNKINKHEAKMYDGIAEWYSEREWKIDAMMQAINENVFINCYNEKLFLCSRDSNGRLWLYNDGKISSEQADGVIRSYDKILEEKKED